MCAWLHMSVCVCIRTHTHTHTCVCFLMTYNVWPCVKELSAFFPPVKQTYLNTKEVCRTWEYKHRISLSPPLLPSLSLSLSLSPPCFPPWVASWRCVRISKVVFQCCIVAGYYRSNTTQGTEALWVLEQLRAKEQMSSPLAVSLSMPHAAPVGIQPP